MDFEEIYIAAYEQIVTEQIDRGVDEHAAERIADEQAYQRAKDMYADMIDMARMRAKEGQ